MRPSTTTAGGLLLPLLVSGELLTVTLPNTPASALASPTPLSETPNTPDPAYWSPLTTLTLPHPTISVPTAANIFHNDLRARNPEPAPQVTGQVVNPASGPGQVSPVTTVQLYAHVGGTVELIQVVYTQLFTTPLDQWSAAQAGEIGLGTIAGQVGVVKTKRDVPAPANTQLPLAVLSDESLRLSAEAKFEIQEEAALPEEKEEEEEEEEEAEIVALEGADCHRPRPVLENKTTKVNAAGSALSLILAIAAMVVF